MDAAGAARDSAGRRVPDVRDFLRTPGLRLSARAALCLSVPLLFSLDSALKLDGILVAIGALWAISQDGLDEWRHRVRRLLGVSMASFGGVVLGAAFAHATSSRVIHVLVVTVVAALAGALEAAGLPAEASYLLVGVIVAYGIAGPLNSFTMGFLVLVGGLWVTLVAVVMDRRTRVADRRAATAGALDALANLFDSVGTPVFEEARDRCITLLDEARDVVGARVPRDPAGPKIRYVLAVALQLGEALSVLSTLHASEPFVAATLRRCASTLISSGPDGVIDEFKALRQRIDGSTSFERALRGALDIAPLTHSSPLTQGRRPRRLPRADQIRAGLALSACCLIATVVSLSLGSHGFWLPLAVAFIFRPDLGPVTTRALARTVGTVIGVAVASLLSIFHSPPLALILLSCLMAMAVPWAARRSHALTVIFFTPIVFILIGAVGPDSGGLLFARVLDTALGALIVFVADLVVWSRSPSRRPDALLTQARRAVGIYEETDPMDDPLVRHARRRDALRSLADLRGALSSARKESRADRRHSPDAHLELNQLSHRVDERSARQFD